MRVARLSGRIDYVSAGIVHLVDGTFCYTGVPGVSIVGLN
jgi:hypothetical protein